MEVKYCGPYNDIYVPDGATKYMLYFTTAEDKTIEVAACRNRRAAAIVPEFKPSYKSGGAGKKGPAISTDCGTFHLYHLGFY